MSTNRFESHLASERGAVIIHVTIALVGLLAFSTFVIDYGVMMAARRQAQNAADAAALAGAISLAYADFDDQGLARQSALAVAAQNQVWGVAPDVTAGDVTFPVCPPGAPGAGTNSCIRVDVFRNERSGGSPLPTFFGRVVGINEQGVRATATAEALFGNSTDCVKPFAIPDKWQELAGDLGAPGWSEEDSYERYDSDGTVLDPADFYSAGTGYTPESVSLGGGDHGRYITLKNGGPHDTIRPGWFHPVAIGGTGGNVYENNIAGCNQAMIGPGTVLDVEPGAMIGPTMHGMRDLIARDPTATWNPNLYGTGKGGVSGGCMGAGTCTVSPRLVAIPIYDPDAYAAADAGGRTELHIVKVLGFFIDEMQGNDVAGWITSYPSDANAGMGGVPGSGFVISVALVR